MAQTPPITSVGPLQLGSRGRSGNVWRRLGVSSISSRFSSLSFFANYRDSGGFETEERPPIGEGGIAPRHSPSLPPRKDGRRFGDDGSEFGHGDAFAPNMESGPAQRPRGNGDGLQYSKPVLFSERFSGIFRRANRLSTLIGGVLGPVKAVDAEVRPEPGPRPEALSPSSSGIYHNGGGARTPQTGNLTPMRTPRRMMNMDMHSPGAAGQFVTVDMDSSNPRFMQQQPGSPHDTPPTLKERVFTFFESRAGRAFVAALLVLVVIIIIVAIAVRPSPTIVVRGLDEDEATGSIRFLSSGIVDGSVDLMIENSNNSRVVIRAVDGTVRYAGRSFGRVQLGGPAVEVPESTAFLLSLALETSFTDLSDGQAFSRRIADDCLELKDGVPDASVRLVLSTAITIGANEPEVIEIATVVGCDMSTIQPVDGVTGG